jgi:peptidoglycan/LPS O-acetylase OafA/YrhL
MYKASSRIPSLDGLRAISIMLVMASHLVYIESFPLPKMIEPLWLDRLGPLGVRVFFVISGFLISSLLFRELETNQSINLGKFYLRRMLRIFPPYYFFILVMIVLSRLDWVKLSGLDIIHALTYTINYYPERSWVIGHGWSLSVEEQFYLLWPAILLLAGKRRGLLISLSFFLIAPFIRLGYFYLKPAYVEYELGFRFETTADAIAIGCLLAGNYKWLLSQPYFHKMVKSRLFILVPILVLFASEINPVRIRYILFAIPIQNIGIAACVAWCITNYKGLIGTILNTRPVAFFGVISYSIYLWQQPFLNPYSSLPISQFPLNLLMVGIVSIISYYFVERPFLMFRQWLEVRMLPGKRLEREIGNLKE